MGRQGLGFMSPSWMVFAHSALPWGGWLAMRKRPWGRHRKMPASREMASGDTTAWQGCRSRRSRQVTGQYEACRSSLTNAQHPATSLPAARRVLRYEQSTGRALHPCVYAVTDSNCSSLAAKEDVDGFLVGGASLKGPAFITICNATHVAATTA